MVSCEIFNICEFIKYEISPYDINFEFEIEDNVFLAKFNGHFTSNKDIELKFRIEQLIKNSFKTNEDLILLSNNFKFDVKKSTLYLNDKLVDLTQKESELVSLLVLNRGFFVSIETLHDKIWENKEISYSDIRMCIKRIREKTAKEFIKTKRFVGYKIDK